MARSALGTRRCAASAPVWRTTITRRCARGLPPSAARGGCAPSRRAMIRCQLCSPILQKAPAPAPSATRASSLGPARAGRRAARPRRNPSVPHPALSGARGARSLRSTPRTARSWACSASLTVRARTRRSPPQLADCARLSARAPQAERMTRAARAQATADPTRRPSCRPTCLTACSRTATSTPTSTRRWVRARPRPRRPLPGPAARAACPQQAYAEPVRPAALPVPALASAAGKRCLSCSAGSKPQGIGLGRRAATVRDGAAAQHKRQALTGAPARRRGGVCGHGPAVPAGGRGREPR